MSVELVVLARKLARIEVAGLRVRLENEGFDDVDIRSQHRNAALQKGGFYLVLVRGTSVPISVALAEFDEVDAGALHEIVHDSARNLAEVDRERIVRTALAQGFDIHISAVAGRNETATRLMLVVASVLAELVDGYVVAETEGLPIRPSEAYRPEAVNRLV
jgi:hypothetical protein